MQDSLLIAVVSFVRSTIGIVTRPYETYRRIANHGSLWELVPLGVILALYFAIASAVKTSAFRPFLLTKQFVVLAAAVLFTYLVVVLLVYIGAKIIGGKGTLRQVGIAWGYTLIPTLLWFFVTSIMYVLIPPPRTASPLGIAFSIVYLVFSIVLLFWKTMLSYLTIRFTMKLDLVKICTVFAVVGSVMGLYSIGMYRLGIFRIPFI